MKSIGIDSGSTMTKGVRMDGAVIEKKIMVPTGPNPRKTLEAVHAELYEEGAYTVTTGYGRNLLKASDKQVTEITCHGLGAGFIHEDIGAVIDIGGQDSKIILLDQGGYVRDFLMNDKCAAGTGRFMEVIVRLLQMDMDDMDTMVVGASPAKISSMCTVFAESEVVSLLAQDVEPASIAKGVVESICRRTANMAMRLPLQGKVFFSGGLSNVAAMQSSLSTHLGMEVVTHENGQYVGAIGAAMIGARQKKE